MSRGRLLKFRIEYYVIKPFELQDCCFCPTHFTRFTWILDDDTLLICSVLWFILCVQCGQTDCLLLESSRLVKTWWYNAPWVSFADLVHHRLCFHHSSSVSLSRYRLSLMSPAWTSSLSRVQSCWIWWDSQLPSWKMWHFFSHVIILFVCVYYSRWERVQITFQPKINYILHKTQVNFNSKLNGYNKYYHGI